MRPELFISDTHQVMLRMAIVLMEDLERKGLGVVGMLVIVELNGFYLWIVESF